MQWFIRNIILTGVLVLVSTKMTAHVILPGGKNMVNSTGEADCAAF
jgi:hypothetical protein